MSQGKIRPPVKRQSQPAAGPPGQITPQLVRQVADKVYALLLAERRIRRERKRSF